MGIRKRNLESDLGFGALSSTLNQSGLRRSPNQFLSLIPPSVDGDDINNSSISTLWESVKIERDNIHEVTTECYMNICISKKKDVIGKSRGGK